MTSKSRIDKLSKAIKPKQDQGRRVKVEVPVNTIYGIDAPDQVIEMRESQVEEMDRILDLVYGQEKEK